MHSLEHNNVHLLAGIFFRRLPQKAKVDIDTPRPGNMFLNAPPDVDAGRFVTEVELRKTIPTTRPATTLGIHDVCSELPDDQIDVACTAFLGIGLSRHDFLSARAKRAMLLIPPAPSSLLVFVLGRCCSCAGEIYYKQI